MLIKDKGIILSIRSISEKSDLIKVLTEHNGLISALSRQSRKNYIYAGATVVCEYVKKSESQIPYIKNEVINDNTIANCISDPRTSIIVSSALHIIELTLVEMVPSKLVWTALHNLLIKVGSNIPLFDKIRAYLSFEISLHILNGQKNIEWFMQEDLNIPNFILQKYQNLVEKYGKKAFVLRLALHASAKKLLNSNLRNARLPESRKLLPKLAQENIQNYISNA